jgi:hypothetical protein
MGSSPVAPTTSFSTFQWSNRWPANTSSFCGVRRLCERPGCGAPAEVSYGIDNATLTVWVDNRALLEREQAGRLCRRHADALTVPHGWTLDDRRQPIPQLFRVVENEPAAKRPAKKTPTPKKEKRDGGPSLFESLEAELAEREKNRTNGVDVVTDDKVIDDAAESTSDQIDPDETKAIPWSPHIVKSDADNDDDDEQPVFGRLLGRAFGKKNQE